MVRSFAAEDPCAAAEGLRVVGGGAQRLFLL